MKITDLWQEMSLGHVGVAHQFVLNATHRCDYSQGRGSYGLVLGLEGEAEYRFCNGNRCRVGQGDVLFLGKEAAYSIAVATAFKHYTVNFDGRAPKAEGCEPFFLWHAEMGEPYIRAFRELSALWQAKRVGYELRARGYVCEILSMLLQDVEGQASRTRGHDRLLPAKEYIEKNYHDEFGLEQLAKLCDMSLTNFRREWSAHYGETAMQYRDRLRLARAKECLSSGYYTVQEVALRCGFADVSYFVRFFKKHVGISPGAFRIGGTYE